MPICDRLSDVREEGLNVWYEPHEPKLQYATPLPLLATGTDHLNFSSIVLVHGLGSHPYWSWYCPGNNTTTMQRSAFRPLTDSLPSCQWVVDSCAPADKPSTASLPTFGTFWPRALLRYDMCDARISTIGYRSRWTSARFETSFKECGEQLLAALLPETPRSKVRRQHCHHICTGSDYSSDQANTDHIPGPQLWRPCSTIGKCTT